MNNNSVARSKIGKMLATAAVLVAGVIAATPSLADSRRHTTVVRETVYHSPSRVIVEPSIIVPLSSSVYLGLGSPASHRTYTTVVREVHRAPSHPVFNHHPGRGHAHGHHKRHEPARGRWSGANHRHDVIYVDRDGRRGSTYREVERRSVVIRDRSR